MSSLLPAFIPWMIPTGMPMRNASTSELTANDALRRTERGELLLYEGDYRNARQLVSAMRRRLENRRRPLPRTPLDAFRAERAQRALEHRRVGRHYDIALAPPRCRLCGYGPHDPAQGM